MKLLVSLTLIFFTSFIFLSCGPEIHEVSIILVDESPDQSADYYIVGNNKQLGNWKPDEIKLEGLGKERSKSFAFPRGTELQFKFTRGSWNSEALGENQKPLANYSVTVNSDTTITYNISFWMDKDFVVDIESKVTGDVKYHKNLKDEKLLPRDISVWLPPNYSKDTLTRFPVLYMHDGQNLFDPSTSFNYVDWGIDEAADSLIKKGSIKPFITVGINNTMNRTAEYSPGDTAQIYMDFVVNKLKPFVDKNYRTLSDRTNTFVAGSSSGGIITFMLLWEHPNIFYGAGCFSPAFTTEHYDYTSNVEDSEINQKFKLFIYNGGKGIDTYLQVGVERMQKVLDEKGYKIDNDYFLVIDNNAEHNEAAWAKQIPRMLKLFFGK